VDKNQKQAEESGNAEQEKSEDMNDNNTIDDKASKKVHF